MNKRKNSYPDTLAIVAIMFGAMGSMFTLIGTGLACFPADHEDFLVGIIFACLGIVFLFLTLGFIFAKRIQSRKIQNAITADSYIWGEIVDILPVYYGEGATRCRYCVLVRHTDTHGQLHIFRSPVLRNYPDRSVIGKSVRIYTDKENFKHYFVDLEGILPNVIEH